MDEQKQSEQAQKPIEPPIDFPVQWDDPAEEKLCWFQFDTNFPNPITPLDFTLLLQAIEIGSGRADAFYGSPDSSLFKRINTYVYFAVNAPADSPEVRTQRAGYVKAVEAATKELELQWSRNWLPEIREHIAYWDEYDLDGASLEALSDHLFESERRLQRVWEIHFLLFAPMILALHLFEEIHEDLWPEDSLLKAHQCLLGYENKTVEGNRRLEALSHQARSDRAISQALMADHPEEVLKQLDAFPEGWRFRVELEDYLNEYGRRSDSQTLSIPSWLEDPRPVIQALRASLAAKETQTEPTHTLAEQREQRLAKVRVNLSGHPPLVAQKFEELLKSAQTAQALSEDHNYWIDIQTTFQVRQVCLEFGRRFVEKGLLNHVEDIFYLTLAELKETSSSSYEHAWQDAVSTRRAIEQEYKGRTPPPLLGAPPSKEELEARNNGMAKAFARMSGPSETPPSDTEESSISSEVLKGYGVSSGIAIGSVKVLHTLEEADNLKPGDVLVAEMITSFWVPLFPRIATMVTVRGGMLSHGAVVAREHGIPAVSGVEKATERLRDGQLIEVNGDTGTIRLLHEKSPA